MAERFWPGATPESAREVVDQLVAVCQQMVADGIPLRCLGATFVPEDESLTCRFDGTPQAVRSAHELAGARFDRLLVIHELGEPVVAPRRAPTIPNHRSTSHEH